MEGINMYDIIIIGGGPAGISAGIYSVSRGKKTLLIEKDAIGGTIGKVSTVTHYSAIVENETGASFASRLKKQALQAGVEIIYETVTATELTGDTKTITTDKGTYQAPRIILASGTFPRQLGIPGEKELSGKGIRLNAARDGENYRGKNIYVIGGADGAVKEALYLAKFAQTLTIIHFEDKLGCIPEFGKKIKETSNIHVRLHSRLIAVRGDSHVETLEILDEQTGKTETVHDPGCGIFIYAGAFPDTHLYEGLTLENGFIRVNEKMETNISGVYAAGDICAKQIRQAATAVSDGAVAGINASM